MRLSGALWFAIVYMSMSYGCDVYSIVDLENPDFGDKVSPLKFSREALEKYSVGDVVVRPRLIFFDPEQTKYYLHVSFYSKSISTDVSVKSVELKVNSQEIEYGNEMIGAPASDWASGQLIEPFYSCDIVGSPIDRPLSEMVDSYVDVSLLVATRREDGSVSEKVISARFLPKKRSYIE